MEIMGRFHTANHDEHADEISFVVVETDEHETLVFEGGSQDEVDAKVEDFLTWAS